MPHYLVHSFNHTKSDNRVLLVLLQPFRAHSSAFPRIVDGLGLVLRASPS